MGRDRHKAEDFCERDCLARSKALIESTAGTYKRGGAVSVPTRRQLRLKKDERLPWIGP